MATPLLGWIKPKDRTRAQKSAHDAAMASLPIVKFALPIPKLAKGQAIRLFDGWNHPNVVADTGKPFKRVWQKTGSCVWAGATVALFTTIAMNRLAGMNPQKAFIPFTMHNYAMSRHYMGEDSQGEGSLGSTFWRSLTLEGVRDWPADPTDYMPDYKIQDDAFSMTADDEMTWSSYRSNFAKIQKAIVDSKGHAIPATGECKTIEDIRAMLSNGYGVSFACNYYIGNGKIVRTGKDAYVKGKWDGRGGHQQSLHAIYEHPDDGPLYWAQNNWPGNTYPKDPNGGPTCGVWVAEADVKTALTKYDSEVFGFSPASWFPAQPKVVELDWLI